MSSRLLSKNLKFKIYKTIILPVVLYGCETWSFTLREKYRLRVFENRILGRVFGPKRDVNGAWRRRVIKSRRLRWAGHVASMEEGRSAFKILTGNLTERWQYNKDVCQLFIDFDKAYDSIKKRIPV